MGFLSSAESQRQANKAQRNSSIVMNPCSEMESTGSHVRSPNFQPMQHISQPPSTQRSAAGDVQLVDFPNNDNEKMDCDEEEEHFDHYEDNTNQEMDEGPKKEREESLLVSKQSSSVKPVEMENFLYDSDEDEIIFRKKLPLVHSDPTQPNERMGELERMQALSKEVHRIIETPGAPNSRPLVRGFAAVAYQAAREHHYFGKKEDGDKRIKQKERPPFPSI